MPANLKVTDPLVNYSFSKDHIMDQVHPCNCILIEEQTTSLTIMRTPQFPTYCNYLSTTLLRFTPHILKPRGRAGRRPAAPAPRGPPGAHFRNRFWCVLFPIEMDFVNYCGAVGGIAERPCAYLVLHLSCQDAILKWHLDFP